MGITIAVGRASDPGKGEVELYLLPNEASPEPRPGLTVFAPRDLHGALHLLRHEYATPERIASLGSARVVGSDPDWTRAIENRLCEFIEDLGNCPVDSWIGAFNAIRNGDLLANGATSAGLIDACRGHPAICVGAGPSATPEMLRHVAHLSRNHYVFAADSMAHACRAAGFNPHFVTMLERPKELAAFVGGVGEGSILIAPPVIDPLAAKEFDRHVWWWAGDALYRWLEPSIPTANCGRSAGTLSVGAAILAGCDPIFLIGHDCAYAPGRVGHCEGAHHLAVNAQKTDDQKEAEGRYGLSKFHVEGYCGGPVLTNGLWNLFRGDIEMLVANNSHCNVFNAAENYAGAKIEGVPLRSLPEWGYGQAVPKVELPKSNIPNPADRKKSIAYDIMRLVKASVLAIEALEKPDCHLGQLSRELVLNRLVSPENHQLFAYLLRSVSYSLALRLHLRSMDPHETAEVHRGCLSILARTQIAICQRMGKDLFPDGCP